jgi:translation initiation factor 2B subunit (eIF-2B alpha/beta/delta family)
MKPTLPQNVQNSIKHIQQDNTSGSVELARKTALTILNLLHQTTNPVHIKHAAYQLINAQPTMASIINLINKLLITIDNTKTQSLPQIIEEYCQHFIHDLDTADKAISQKTNPLIKNNATIITHSYSSTILNTLLNAKLSNKSFSVICTESRPKNEGIRLAKKLAENGIPVKLIVDSAVFSILSDADIILVGGDAVTTTGLVNKIGTSGIALTAHQQKIPIFTLCSTIKFLPSTYPLQLYQIQNPDEIIKLKSSNITPLNYYFDITPLEHLDGIITENHIFKPPEIPNRLDQLKLHTSLA